MLAVMLFASGLVIGICAVAGICGVIWGPEVFKGGPPDRSQPYFWVTLILFAPFMIMGMASSIVLFILPLAAWMRIPVIERQSWKNVVPIYRYLKRTRYDASPEEKQREQILKGRILKPHPVTFSLHCLLLGGLCGACWSLVFFPIMKATSNACQTSSNFEKLVLPIMLFAFGGVLTGWIIRKTTSKLNDGLLDEGNGIQNDSKLK